MAHMYPQGMLRHYFSGLTEQTFISTLGIGDPALIDYLSELLCRFVHIDQIYLVRNVQGQQMEELAAMIMAAEGYPPEGRTRREVYRHIGDFTLFWTGLFPEQLKRMQSRFNHDFFIEYCTQGKRSYLIASTFDDETSREEAPVLRRLSNEFELCAYGLNHVRAEWTHQGTDGMPFGQSTEE